MAAAQQNIPRTQSALRWVRASDKNPFEWSTSAPVIQPSELGENQVLIENHAVSLNPIDYKIAELNFLNIKLPAVTGYDVSGRVVAVGKSVKDFKIGDEVFGVLSINSSNGGGAFQQYSVGEFNLLTKKPANISHTDAATLGIAFLVAMEAFRQVNVNSSTSVFIPGGSGGVGHFSVQIARIQGAKQIITTASKEDGIRILKEKYQIKDVINHATENVVARVLELTHGQGADIVYDSTYLEANFAKSIPTVKQGGSWIVLGHFAQEGSVEAKSVAERKAKLLHADLGPADLGPLPVGPEKTAFNPFVRNTLIQGAKWIQEGKLKPYINQIIKLEEVENALGRLKQGKDGFGKIVVKLL